MSIRIKKCLINRIIFRWTEALENSIAEEDIKK